MSVSFHLNKAQLEALKAKLKAAREGLQNDGVAMRQVAVFLDQWVQRNFQSSGEKVGGWEPFKYGGRIRSKKGAKAQSVESHRYIDASAKLLMDTGALRLSFLPFIRKGIAGIGSDLPYSKAHEDGMKSRNLPQRRMLPKTKEVEFDVREIIQNFITVQVRKTQ